MKDRVGNELRKGQLIYWVSRGLTCNIIEIVEPALEESGAASLALAIPVPIEIPKGHSLRNFSLVDFIVCANPEQQEQLAAAMDRLKGRSGVQ
jgi:hypothetical protein